MAGDAGCVNPKTGRYILVGGRTDRRLRLAPYHKQKQLEAFEEAFKKRPPKKQPRQQTPPAAPAPTLKEPDPETPEVTKKFNLANPNTNPKKIVYPAIWHKYGLA